MGMIGKHMGVSFLLPACLQMWPWLTIIRRTGCTTNTSKNKRRNYQGKNNLVIIRAQDMSSEQVFLYLELNRCFPIINFAVQKLLNQRTVNIVKNKKKKRGFLHCKGVSDHLSIDMVWKGSTFHKAHRDRHLICQEKRCLFMCRLAAGVTAQK